MTRQAVYI